MPNHQLLTGLKVAKHLGFAEVWISNPSKANIKVLTQISTPEYPRVFQRIDIGLHEKNKANLISIIRQQRRQIPIIAMTCTTPDIAAWAAQDNRVDILKFRPFEIGKLLNRSVAKLMNKYQKHLEISLIDLYAFPYRTHIATIRNIRNALIMVLRKHISFIISSGSARLDQLRTPRELASLGQILLNNTPLPLDALSTTPRNLLTQNLQKIVPEYVIPGVFKTPSPNNHELEER